MKNRFISSPLKVWTGNLVVISDFLLTFPALLYSNFQPTRRRRKA